MSVRYGGVGVDSGFGMRGGMCVGLWVRGYVSEGSGCGIRDGGDAGFGMRRDVCGSVGVGVCEDAGFRMRDVGFTFVIQNSIFGLRHFFGYSDLLSFSRNYEC